jgi:PAS domain S-box-containing protein
MNSDANVTSHQQLQEENDALSQRLAEMERKLAACQQQNTTLLQQNSDLHATIKHLETKACKYQEQYRIFSQLASDYAYALRANADGTFSREWVTDAFTRITGYTPAEIEDRGGWEALVHPEDRAIALEHGKRLLAGEQCMSEFRIITRDGQVRWLQQYGQGVWDTTHQHVVSIYSAAHDVTEYKCIEKALQTSEEKYRNFFEQSKDGLILLDDQGVILEWNEGAEEIFGLKREQVIGQPRWDAIYDLVPVEYQSPEIYERIKATTLEFIRSGGTSILPQWSGHTIQCPDGTRKFVTSRVFPIHTRNGFLVGSIVRDMTEHQRDQEALEQARAAAEAAARAKSDFLANMSHEIRTPLNAVIGMTTLLQGTMLNPEQQDYVETIRTSGEALLMLINDILDFSKIEAGKLDLEHTPFTLCECLEEVLELLAPRAAEKVLNLAYFVDEQTPCKVIGDKARLRQILLNLLSNGIKFTEQGEVVVMVSSDQPGTAQDDTGTQPERVRLHFSISDTGIGIPQERLNQLFQSFSQVDASITRKYGGTGLGLAISKLLVELMDGKVWVESKEGEGSTFYFMITLERQPAAPPCPADVEHPAPVLAGKRILILEQSTTNRYIFNQLVTRWNMHARDTASPEEARNWLRAGEVFDIVLIDTDLPETDAVELAQELRSLAATQGVHDAADLHNNGRLNGTSGTHSARLPRSEQNARTPSDTDIDIALTDHTPAGLPVILTSSILKRREVAQRAEEQVNAVLVKPLRPSVLHKTLACICKGEPVHDEGESHPLTFNPSAHDPSLRILVAEDHLVNQKLARLFLDKLGYQPEVVANGQEVLDALQQHSYDVILMDIQMPEMDGIAATKHIRQQLPASQQPYIIAMTAHALTGIREWIIENGMDDYLSKPVRIEDLEQRLQQVARQRRVGTTTDQLAVQMGAHTHATLPLQQANGSNRYSHLALQQPRLKNTDSVDRKALESLMAMLGDPCVVQELISMYLEETPQELSRMQSVLAQDTLKGLIRPAHSLKSSSAQLGAHRLAELFKELEMMGLDEAYERARTLLEEIHNEFEHVQQDLLTKASGLANVGR